MKLGVEEEIGKADEAFVIRILSSIECGRFEQVLQWLELKKAPKNMTISGNSLAARHNQFNIRWKLNRSHPQKLTTFIRSRNS
jgi:hypothetical protein